MSLRNQILCLLLFQLQSTLLIFVELLLSLNLLDLVTSKNFEVVRFLEPLIELIDFIFGRRGQTLQHCGSLIMGRIAETHPENT